MWKKVPRSGITEDQVKIEENSMIQTTRAPNVEMEKIGDIGRTGDPLELLNDPANTFLYSTNSELVDDTQYILNLSQEFCLFESCMGSQTVRRSSCLLKAIFSFDMLRSQQEVNQKFF